MAEGLVTDLIKQLVSVAALESEQEIRLVVGVDEEVEKLKCNLQTVTAVLNDAEKRQVTEETVKLWLEKLKDACYKMNDVIDEWNTAMIKSTIKKEEENVDNAHPVMKKKVRSFIIPSPSCCFHEVDKLVMRHDIAHKIKDLNRKLDEIVKEKDRYQFKLSNDPVPEVVNRPTTTSFVDVSEIFGRENVKNNLVRILLGRGGEEERRPRVISLVGMGGLGKTTLAQLAYNDPKVQDHFEIKVWVCVTDPFDKCKVAKEILESIEGQSPNLTTLQSLLDRICANIANEKFFLVLDDVWTEDYTMWDQFKVAFQCVALSSYIIVTTRKSRVAEMMGSVSVINLSELSKLDCWLIFSKIAFLDKDPEQCEQLEDIGRQIAKRCKGLPLAAKTLGSLMRFKKSREEWKTILNSNLWELEDVEKGLFASLLLSYYDLSSPLKQCFSYCAILPKGYIFSSDDLVFMWMAQGYIPSKSNMEMEVIGREYFENLFIRSFFQAFKEYPNDDKIRICKMHDIVHDFAQLMSKNECFTINSDIKLDSAKKEDIELGLDFKNARHLWLEISDFPRGIGRLISLRTLSHFYVSSKDDCKGCKLGELKNLNHLQGTLRIIGLGNEEDISGAKDAQLKKKIGLHTLSLWFVGWDFEDTRRESDALVLNALESPPDLEHLSIEMYQATTMSINWTMSLTKLKMLDIRYTFLEHMPPLGKLPFLKSLHIKVAKYLKKVGNEFLGIESRKKKDNIIVFPNLKALTFDGLREWEEWIGIGAEEDEEDCIITIMPHLQQLEIWSCPKLKSLPNFLHTTPLQNLGIYGCPIVKERCEGGIGEDWHKISHVPNINFDIKHAFLKIDIG
nr:putative disease resistance RPP13-like protein 1 [Quercus suber]